MNSNEQVAKEVDNITDGLGKPIDKNIKSTIIALHMADIPTSASCEGHYESGMPYPWVLVCAPRQEEEAAWTQVNRAYRHKVEALLQEFYRNHKSEYPLVLQDQGIFGAFRIQSFYWDQKDEIDKDNLSTYQQEMKLFADFLMSKLQDNTLNYSY